MNGSDKINNNIKKGWFEVWGCQCPCKTPKLCMIVPIIASFHDIQETARNWQGSTPLYYYFHEWTKARIIDLVFQDF